MKQKKNKNPVCVISKLALILMVESVIECNLLKKGNFQNYTLISLGTNTSGGQVYDELPDNNYSEWYNGNHNYFEVKEYYYQVNSKGVGADLRSSSPIKLCQNVNLDPSNQYQLSLDILGDQIITYSIINITLGTQQIAAFNASDYIYLTPFTAVFTPTLPSAPLCFYPTINYVSGANFIYMISTGPILDNIELQIYTPSSQGNSTTTNSSQIGNTTNNQTIDNNSSISSSNQTENAKHSINQTENTTQGINQTENNFTISQNTQNGTNSSNINDVDQNTTGINETNNLTQNSGNASMNKNQQIIVNFISQHKYDKFLVVLTSDLIPSLYGISLNEFKTIKIYIQKEFQSKTNMRITSQGILTIQIEPERIYNYYDLGELQIYFPSSIAKYRFKIFINGKQFVYTPLTESEMKLMQNIQPVAAQVVEGFFHTYKVMNAASCSYLILNLIGFWNLALLYNFLQIKTQPSFSKNALEGATVILYERNTLIRWGTKLTGRQVNLNSKFLSETQKVSLIRDRYAWFGNMGISSNFLANHLENIVLLGFLIFKYFFFNRIIVRKILRKCAPFQTIGGLKFIHIFVAEMSCFAPFFIIPIVEIFKNMGQSKFGGKVNVILHIMFVVILVIMPIASYSINYSKIVQYVSKMKKSENRRDGKEDKDWRKLVKLNKYQNNERLSYYLFNLSVSVLVAFGNKPAFFTINSLILIWRIKQFFQSKSFFSGYNKFYRFQGNFIWLTYHSTFMYLYLSEVRIQDTGRMSLLQMKSFKYCGFIILSCIIVGGILDIVDFIINLIGWIIEKVKFMRKNCGKTDQQSMIKSIKSQNNVSIDCAERQIQDCQGSGFNLFSTFQEFIKDQKINLSKISNGQKIHDFGTEKQQIQKKKQQNKKRAAKRVGVKFVAKVQQKVEDQNNIWKKFEKKSKNNIQNKNMEQKQCYQAKSSRKIKRTNSKNPYIVDKMMKTQHENFIGREEPQYYVRTGRRKQKLLRDRRLSKDDNDIAFIRQLFQKNNR